MGRTKFFTTIFFVPMDFSVTRSNQGLVRPIEQQTPPHTLLLHLSAIDCLPALRFNVRTLHVFGHGQPEATRVIKEALSKALVPYYPLAGRLKESTTNGQQLQIECCGEGVWFVEAAADCSLDSVHYFDDVVSIPYDKLLPKYVPETDHSIEPLVQMQVTQFEGGGFVIGLVFCHSICDGLGAAQFLNAVGEFARGFANPTILPEWSRDCFPLPPNPTTQLPSLPPTMPDYKLQRANLDISMDQIKNLKTEFLTSTGKICSTFEAVGATFWKNRTQSVKFNPNAEVKLVFFANCRDLLNPPLPLGFYGNCFFPVTIASSSETLEKVSIFEVIKLIQDAKTKLPSEFEKYMKGERLGDEDPYAPPVGYTTLFLTEWGRLGFNQVDYGWGVPMHIVPIPMEGASTIPAGIAGSVPLPKKGVRLMTCCVEETHRQSFIDEMMKLI